MDNKEKLKNLIRQGKEIGYILQDDLDLYLSNLSEVDRQYITETLEGMQIQLVKTISEYDEYKYLSGAEAIKILESLSDGNHEAFIKPKNNDEK